MDDVVDCQDALGRYQSGSPGGGGYGTPMGRTGWSDAALIVPSDNMNIQLNLDKYTMYPVYAELVCDGRVTVFIQIKDWV